MDSEILKFAKNQMSNFLLHLTEIQRCYSPTNVLKVVFSAKTFCKVDCRGGKNWEAIISCVLHVFRKGP